MAISAKPVLSNQAKPVNHDTVRAAIRGQLSGLPASTGQAIENAVMAGIAVAGGAPLPAEQHAMTEDEVLAQSAEIEKHNAKHRAKHIEDDPSLAYEPVVDHPLDHNEALMHNPPADANGNVTGLGGTVSEPPQHAMVETPPHATIATAAEGTTTSADAGDRTTSKTANELAGEPSTNMADRKHGGVEAPGLHKAPAAHKAAASKAKHKAPSK